MAWNTLDRFGKTQQLPWKAFGTLLGAAWQYPGGALERFGNDKGTESAKGQLKWIIFQSPLRAQGSLDWLPGALPSANLQQPSGLTE